MRWLLLIAAVAFLAGTQIAQPWASDQPKCSETGIEYVVLADGTEAWISAARCD